MSARWGRVWIVWGTFLGMIAAVVLLELREQSRVAEGTSEQTPGAAGSRMLLPVPVAQLHAVEIGHSGALHRFERDATGAWFYHGAHGRADHVHQSDPAQAQVIDKTLTVLGRARMERRLKPEMPLRTYGLASPQMILLIFDKANPLPLAQYTVGDVAPDGVSRYVLPAGSSSVVTIASYQTDQLLDLIASFARP